VDAHGSVFAVILDLVKSSWVDEMNIPGCLKDPEI
jgi:hypothetical protein